MKLTLFIGLFFSSFTTFAITWNVEVGGEVGGNPLPYYDPQFMNIYEGDIVQWTIVGGEHNIVSTGGAATFGSGTLFPGQFYSFQFNISGIYTYECTLPGHADTQYGSIFVMPTGVAVIEKEAPVNNIVLFPNPVADVLQIKQIPNDTAITICNAEGKVMARLNAISNEIQQPVADWPQGVYWMELRHTNTRRMERIIIQR
jgi:hypothetical protein